MSIILFVTMTSHTLPLIGQPVRMATPSKLVIQFCAFIKLLDIIPTVFLPLSNRLGYSLREITFPMWSFHIFTIAAFNMKIRF